ncbi:ABC transporter permease [Kiloniella laminariae]|uniref:ABC transporter permease n=1 Tax=Kiloniella laminariae TaxID=454162 RepID=UPI00035F18CF|nr:ABC transporter permease subunit [Kiloniella laminariae]
MILAARNFKPEIRNFIGIKGFWLSAFVISVFFYIEGKGLFPKWMFSLPRKWQWPIKDYVSDFMIWLTEDASFGFFTFKEMTRGLAGLLEWPLSFATSLLSSGFLEGQGSQAVQVLPSLSWISVVTVVIAMGYYARDWKLAALVGGCFLYLAVFGQWDSAMITLASIAIAVPFGVAAGLLVGIAGYRWPAFERSISPLLDLMQTVPVFAYLVPILFLFGFGPVAAMIATVIYSMPPMIRISIMSLKGVPSEILDFGNMAGCTKRQLMWKVLVPSAMPGLMVGVNQVIMLSLNMVIIASMIGAGGLGYDVLSSLRRLDLGGGLEAGIAIVVLAIALDRLSQAFSQRGSPTYHESKGSFVQNHPWLTTVAIVTAGTFVLGMFVPSIQSYPESLEIGIGESLAEAVKWINITFFDALESYKTVVLVYFMVPVKLVLLKMPWAWSIFLLSVLSWQLGGIRLVLLTLCLSLFIVVTGMWEKAMITVYLCGVSVVIATLFGVPLGILAAENERLGRIVQVIIDTLQTLPSFVYLIPVVMLFRVGDFSAMVAVVLYAIAPAVRYAVHGIRQIPPALIEAGITSGCTKRQLLWKIKLPLALPEILLGLNQTIMLALSMLVITALVGTRDLGQEVYIALTKADTGRGIVAGLAIAFIAIIADRMIAAGSAKARKRLGLG